jgi:hypothetical protein
MNCDDLLESLNESKQLEEYVKSIVAKQYKNVDGTVPNQQPSQEEVLQATKLLCATIAKAFVGYFMILFADAKLSAFALNTIEKNKANKKLFDFVDKEVEAVYKKHKNYRPCSLDEFKHSSIYNYMLAEWRDKSAKEKAKLAAYKTLDGTILALVSKVPVPGSALLAIPVKMMLTYVGCDIGIGSIYNIVVNIDGQTLSIGINYRPIGFTLSNFVLYTFNDEGKMIATKLKNPPEKLYRITTADMEEILDKYGRDSGLETLKKWVKYTNEDK